MMRLCREEKLRGGYEITVHVTDEHGMSLLVTESGIVKTFMRLVVVVESSGLSLPLPPVSSPVSPPSVHPVMGEGNHD